MRFTRLALLLMMTTGTSAYGTPQAHTIRQVPVYFDRQALVQGAYSPYRIGGSLTATSLTHPLRTPILTVSEVSKANRDDKNRPLSLRSCPVTELGIPSRSISVYFRNGSSRLSSTDCQTLRSFIRQLPVGASLHIDGYASQPGSRAVNIQISRARAREAAACMTVPPTTIKGHGFVRLSLNDAKNRRVTVTLSPQEVSECPVDTTRSYWQEHCSAAASATPMPTRHQIENWFPNGSRI